MLSSLYLDREELLLQDCEWKMRSTQQSCKARIVEAEKLKNEALEKAIKIEAEARAQFEKVNYLLADHPGGA